MTLMGIRPLRLLQPVPRDHLQVNEIALNGHRDPAAAFIDPPVDELLHQGWLRQPLQGDLLQGDAGDVVCIAADAQQVVACDPSP